MKVVTTLKIHKKRKHPGKIFHVYVKFFTEEVTKLIVKLPTNKVSLANDIPTSSLKQLVNAYCTKLTNTMSDLKSSIP